MNLVASIGMPGPLEMLIIGAVCLGIPLVAVAIVLFALAQSKRAGQSGAQNANLAPCPDCGRLVSRLAPNCPQCGRPLTPQAD